MTAGHDISEDLVHELAAELSLPLDDDAASEFVGPIAGIIASMDPVTQSVDDSPAEAGRSLPEIETHDGDDPHNAFVTRVEVRHDDADGLLSDRTVALKDNIALAGVRLTAGSGLLAECVPTRNATVTDRLLDAGATIVGKTNMDEFAFGPTGETSYYGPTENPSASGHTPGGSSSGSGAAATAGDADIALGTDTGGSVRIPASYCGVVGYKPTQGAIPLDGIVELARSLDTVGVLGQRLDDVRDGLAVLAGKDSLAESAEPKDIDSLTLGIPTELFDEPVAEPVAAHVEQQVEELVSRGCERVDLSVPEPAHSSAVWRAVTMSELYAFFATATQPYRIPHTRNPPFATDFRNALASRLDTLSTPLKQYLLIGAYLVTRNDGALYSRAIEHRHEMRERVREAMVDVDVLVSPSTPTTANRFGEFSRDTSPPINNNTHLFNITGHPAISLPCGELDSLPVGIQLVAPLGGDADLLSVAATVGDVLDLDC